jgi:NAD+ synthetase
MPVLDPQALIDNRVEAIREFHKTTGQAKAEIDISGGVDSAVMLGLLALALGPENVIAAHSRIHTNPEQTARAHEVAEVFGVRLIDLDFTGLYNDLVLAMGKAMSDAGYDAMAAAKRFADDPTILGSIRSTIRAPIGRGFNRMAGGGIRHGTGNECEDRWARFFQKGGDGEVDTNPLAMLSKGEVFQLALKLGVPRSIIAARPSPDLWGKGDGHNDEDEFALYFGFKAADYGQTFYSYIDMETGEYTQVGLIERVSRLLDEPVTPAHGVTYTQTAEAYVFGEGPSISVLMPEHIASSAAFDGLGADLSTILLMAARKVERQTRHKFNPNCPSLGNRSDLVKVGILTDKLPEEEA